MRYVSTRDTKEPRRYFSFIDAVLEGLAPDGGLLVPETLPTITAEEWSLWKQMEYQELCYSVLRKFIDTEEMTDAELKSMIAAAYTTKSFRTIEVAPLVPVGEIQVMELFHGPTYAFKDIALQLLGQFFDFALRKRNSRRTILGATSGDTGSAAIAGVKGRSNIDCVILFPLGKTSRIQEMQMTSNLEKNIHCLAVENAVFDDCQSIVKSCFGDAQFNDEMSLGAVNSINWSRILAQVVYYVYAAARVDGPVSFVVPTGNFGNMLAGYYAQQMGVNSIKRLVIASNSNDILPKFFETGKYKVSGHVVLTMSPSMDIAVSSNFERYLFDLWGRRSEILAEKFEQLRTEKCFSVTDDELRRAREQFLSYSVDEKKTLNTIASTFAEHKYLLCPHSAVGFEAAKEYLCSPQFEGETVVTLATAHIGKFTEHILNSLEGVEYDPHFREAVEESVPEGLAQLVHAKTRRIDIPNSIDAIKKYLRDHVVVSSAKAS